MNLILLLFSSQSFAAPEKPFPIDIELRRGGKVVCSVKREITEGDEYFLCESKVQGNRAFARVGARRFSKSQLQITGTIEEFTSSGRINISTPSITILSGEPASFSIDSPNAPDDSLSMKVTATFPGREVSSTQTETVRVPLTKR